MAHRFFLPQRPKIRRFRKVSGRSGLKNCQKAVPLNGPADGDVRPSVYSASSLIGPCGWACGYAVHSKPPEYWTWVSIKRDS